MKIAMKTKYLEIWISYLIQKRSLGAKNTVSAFNNDYIQYESMGDKNKDLSIK